MVHSQRVRSFCKGGGKTQRWGRIAKRWGENAKVGYYRKEKLMEVVKDRGYQTQRAVADAIAPVFGITRRVAMNKIKSGKFTKEECEVIGSIFEMTMKEYYDVFMFGLFQEDREGHYRCKVDDIYRHLHPQPMTVSPVERARMMRERLSEEIEEIEFDE